MSNNKIKNPLDSIDIDIDLFKSNKKFEIKCELDTIINYNLSKNKDFLINNNINNLNKEKIEKQYNIDTANNGTRGAGFKKNEKNENIIKFDILKDNLDYRIIFVSLQYFVSFFFYSTIKNILNLNNLTLGFNLGTKKETLGMFSYIDNSYNKIYINNQKYHVFADIDIEKIICKFEYNYEINIEDNEIKFIYKIDWDTTNNFNKKIKKLSENIYLLRKIFEKENNKKIQNLINKLNEYYITNYKPKILRIDSNKNIITELDFYSEITDKICGYYKKEIYNINNLTKFVKKDFFIINFDEKKQDFDNEYLNDILFKIKIQQPSFIIVCTQNCKTSGNKHFQHVLKEILENKENDYTMVIKNSDINNIRTRIYCKNSNKKFSVIKKEIHEYSNVQYGNGLIYIILEIEYKNRLFKFIFFNCNLTDKRETELNNIIEDFKLYQYYKQEYNIFLLGYFNFPFIMKKENKINLLPINFIKNYNSNTTINKKFFYDKYYENDGLYNFLEEKEKKYKTVSPFNFDKHNLFNNFINSIKKIGFHITYNNIYFDKIIDLYIFINKYIDEELINLKNGINNTIIKKNKINFFIDIYKIINEIPDFFNIISYEKKANKEKTISERLLRKKNNEKIINKIKEDYNNIINKIHLLKLEKIKNKPNNRILTRKIREIVINKNIELNFNYKVQKSNNRKLIDTICIFIDKLINDLNRYIIEKYKDIKIIQINRYLYCSKNEYYTKIMESMDFNIYLNSEYINNVTSLSFDLDNIKVNIKVNKNEQKKIHNLIKLHKNKKIIRINNNKNNNNNNNNN